MKEKKTGSYLKYAIGEIILVVIGILIALQINNWNENRKNENYEKAMLSELNEQLKNDKRIIDNWLPSLERIVSTINKVAAIKQDSTLPTDSLQLYLERIRGFGIMLSFNTSAYNAINSGGLDKISDPEIRTLISEIYGDSMPKITHWINEIVRESLYERDRLFRDIYNPIVIPGSDGVIRTELIVENAEALRNNPKADELLSSLNWPLPLAIRRMKNLSQKMEKLIIELDTYLK